MGIPPSEALGLTLYDYSGILSCHNASLDPDGTGGEVEAPEEHEMLLAWAHAERIGAGKMVH